jgi:DNA/RNA-binding domain of Phe-tRNA-synthetase-like protein
MLSVSAAWRQAFPGAVVGVLTMEGVANPGSHPGLEERKRALEVQLRARYAGLKRQDLKRLPVIQAYDGYYKRFKKSYHVLLQLESLVLKGKSIPARAGLVEAVFMAELEDLLLTATHDLDRVQPPLALDIAGGDEHYTGINGQDQVLKKGDMYIRDSQGVLSSIIYGPDRRTRLRLETTRALFTTYAPAGIGSQAVEGHLAHIREQVTVLAPQARVRVQELVTA